MGKYEKAGREALAENELYLSGSVGQRESSAAVTFGSLSTSGR